ncbi:serine/arginine repetitive matrix protein 1-like [Neocloeon triangulifer]|uniref:serine/arginine repetitive matrix protein 1-like n=1 Tax=Neocloeon triangulifer TaxID=2078957 RepID=UPI00286EE513|nr:serine/arginine repetitive matrix protein 1-like [Neocloeon triangulifer]XP_059491282.1 serine/arginine repetitive matrix protein 1-like [Neocloeon triangulifer]
MAASRADAEVTSTVKSGSDSMYDEDDEVLRISYRDVPDDFFDSLVTDEWSGEKSNSRDRAGPSKEEDLRVVIKEKKSIGESSRKSVNERRKTTDSDKRSDNGKEPVIGPRRSRTPEKRKGGDVKRGSPKRRRSISPRRRSRSPLRRPPPARRRSPLRKRSPSPRRLSPRKRSISPRRKSPVHRRSSPRRKSGSRSPKRRRSPSPDLFSARMNSRRNRPRRSTSPKRSHSTSLSPENTNSRYREPMKLGMSRIRGRTPPRSRTPPQMRRSRTPPRPFLPGAMPTMVSQPSLEEIASGAVTPYGMPAYPPYPGQMMYNYPQGPYPAPLMSGYPQHQFHGVAIPPVPGVDASTLSTAYPLPQPVPKPTDNVEYPPVVPSKPTVKPKQSKKAPPPPSLASLDTSMTKDSLTSAMSASSVYEVEDPGTKKSMKLSDYLASMTAASHKPMEYKKHVDDRIKAAIAKFDATFLQPLRFHVTPSTVTIAEKENTGVSNPNQSPLLKNPTVKLGNLIRPLNLRALKIPDKPQFVCKKPELAPPKPEISIKTLLSKKQPVKRDTCTSPIPVLTEDSWCQTDPIPEPPPPVCYECEERSRKTYMNHWTQVKRVELVNMAIQTADLPIPPMHRLGPPVDPFEEDLRHSLQSRTVSPWEYNNEVLEDESPRHTPELLMGHRERSRSPPPRYISPPPYIPHQPIYNSPPHEVYRSPSPPPRYIPSPRRSPTPPPRRRNSFFCGECNIEMNSEAQLNHHRRTQRHLQRLEVMESERRAQYERPAYDRADRRGPPRHSDSGNYSGSVWNIRKPY